MFNWPSSGGGNVHTVQLAQALQNANYEVHHFFIEYEPWTIGRVENNPIHSQAIIFNETHWSLAEVQSRMRATIRECAPDFVLVTDCWSLKPWLAEALSDWPYILRFDGMECLCPLNNLRVIPHPNRYLEPCTKHRLATPACCLTCVAERSRFVGRRHQFEREFSQFHTQEYHELFVRSLANAETVLVHNPLIAAALDPYAANVRVVPIGVDANTFGKVPPLQGGQARARARSQEQGAGSQSRKTSRSPTVPSIKRVLFGGRTNDLVKGFQVLRAAGEMLWRTRQDLHEVESPRAHRFG